MYNYPVDHLFSRPLAQYTTVTCRISRLYHEAFDVPMEETIIIVITGTQCQEVL